jgi:hypothetical protein
MAETAAFELEARERLNRLERELRYWRYGGLVCLVLATVGAACAMDDPPPKELRAETLKIVERGGKERLVLTAVKGIPDMTFFDPDGKGRLTLDIADDHQPVLRVSDADEKGQGSVIIGLENGSPNLQFYDRRGQKRVTLGVPTDTGALIRIYNDEGKFVGRIP